MFVYLDNWSLKPITVLWVVNLVMFGVAGRSNKKVTPHPQSHPVSDQAGLYKPDLNYPVVRYRPQASPASLPRLEETETWASPSLFLNSFTAIFFPTCHLHLPHTNNKEHLGKVEIFLDSVRSQVDIFIFRELRPSQPGRPSSTWPRSSSSTPCSW